MTMGIKQTQHPFFISVFFLGLFLVAWHLATISPPFDPTGKTDEELLVMEFNGDIMQTDDGRYVWNPEKEKAELLQKSGKSRVRRGREKGCMIWADSS